MTTVRNISHGLKHSRVYRIWCAMKTRCTNPNIPNAKDYSGRGIAVCERWLSFENFLADMGEPPTDNHSLDRFPNKDGDYEPANCRWATEKEQQRNKRNNRVLEFRGETKTVAEWSESLGIHVQTILHRLRAGWTVEDALGRQPDGWSSRRSQYGETGHR